MRYLLSSFLAMLLVLAAGVAHAEEPAAPKTPPAAPAAQEEKGRWGYILVGAGIAIGGSLTTYGLFIRNCDEDELSCKKGASTAIWTGIGIASLSSVIGIAIVQSGRSRSKTSVSVSVDAARPGLALHGTF